MARSSPFRTKFMVVPFRTHAPLDSLLSRNAPRNARSRSLLIVVRSFRENSFRRARSFLVPTFPPQRNNEDPLNQIIKSDGYYSGRLPLFRNGETGRRKISEENGRNRSSLNLERSKPFGRWTDRSDCKIKGYFHSTTPMQSFLMGFLRGRQKRALIGLSGGGLPARRAGLLVAALGAAPAGAPVEAPVGPAGPVWERA